eukprot:TRINITY_DN3029_c0_g1_i2.p1 TRINITY_DN3029_c0_g1~~TRINITY_DN3029_c0_g1_i2.p1  ORF type:complete len:620 (+),score=185.17 TRINITY_DN3029_c0_g1_i2:115-1974(+)
MTSTEHPHLSSPSPSSPSISAPPSSVHHLHHMVESLVLRQGGDIKSSSPHIGILTSPVSSPGNDVRRRAITLSSRVPPPPPLSTSLSSSPVIASTDSPTSLSTPTIMSRHLSMQRMATVPLSPLSSSSPISSPSMARSRAKTTVTTTTQTDEKGVTTTTTIVSTTSSPSDSGIHGEKLTDRIPPPPPLSAPFSPTIMKNMGCASPSLSSSSPVPSPFSPSSLMSPPRSRSPSLNALSTSSSSVHHPSSSSSAPLSPFMSSSAGITSPTSARSPNTSFPPISGNQVNKGRIRSISAPYNCLKHSGGLSSSTDSIVEIQNTIEEQYSDPLSNKMRGYLFKLAGVSFKKRWFEIEQHLISYYSKQGSRNPRGQIDLIDSKFEHVSLPNRPHTILLHAANKKQYYISSDDKQELSQWISAFQRGGAVDKDFLKKEAADKAVRNKEEQKERDRAQRKAESDYIQKLRRQADRTDIITDATVDMTDEELVQCECVFNVVPSLMTDSDVYGRKLYRVEVVFAGKHWVILRTYEKILHLYRETNMILPVPLILPPSHSDKGLNAAHFQANQLILLQRFMDTLAEQRASVLLSYPATRAFLKFIAPVCWQDEKPIPFQMPFQLPVDDS